MVSYVSAPHLESKRKILNPCVIKLLKVELREVCVMNLHLKTISDRFSNAGFREVEITPNVSGERRALIERFFASENWKTTEALRKLMTLIEGILQLHFLPDVAKEQLRTVCRESGLKVEDNGHKITCSEIILETTLFKKQFPAGLPFGIPKPEFAVKAQDDGQQLNFELKEGIGIIETDVYPDFTFRKFAESFGLSTSTDGVLRKALIKMNQTGSEAKFFLAYAQKFKMADRTVPALIPQAWIQWHSLSKRALRSISSTHVDEIYRVDFVAFWNNQRFAILIDDIGHYAVQKSEGWQADEESYTKLLKENRKLEKENWNVFRISNWEVKQEHALQEAVEAFQEFIGFE